MDITVVAVLVPGENGLIVLRIPLHQGFQVLSFFVTLEAAINLERISSDGRLAAQRVDPGGDIKRPILRLQRGGQRLLRIGIGGRPGSPVLNLALLTRCSRLQIDGSRGLEREQRDKRRGNIAYHFHSLTYLSPRRSVKSKSNKIPTV